MTPDVVAFLYSFTQEAMWRLMLGGALGGALAWALLGPLVLRAIAWLVARIGPQLRRNSDAYRLACCPACNGSGVSATAYRTRLKALRHARKAA